MLRQSLSLKMRSKRKGWVWPISSGLTFDLYKTNIVLFFTRSGLKFDPTNVSKNLFFFSYRFPQKIPEFQILICQNDRCDFKELKCDQ